MHIQTHVLSGWCVADLLNLSPRERAFAMVAASAADLDGLGLFVSIEYYVKYHHVLAHNIFFGLLLTFVLTAFSTHRLKAFALYLALFHLHLVLDYFGSGPGWSISYFWPLSSAEFLCAYAWPLTSWQNFLAGSVFIAWMIAIAFRHRRTPFEAITPSFEAKIIHCIDQRAKPDKPPSPGQPASQSKIPPPPSR